MRKTYSAEDDLMAVPVIELTEDEVDMVRAGVGQTAFAISAGGSAKSIKEKCIQDLEIVKDGIR